MKIQGKHMVVVVFLLSSVFLAYDSLSNYVNPYISITQIVSRPERYVAKNVQVIGVPDFDSVKTLEDGVVTFDITEEGQRVSVIYRGTMPQNFDQSEQVVAIGIVNEDGALESQQILTKCPSKYESNEEPKRGNQMFIAAMLVAVAAVAYLAVTTFWKKG